MDYGSTIPRIELSELAESQHALECPTQDLQAIFRVIPDRWDRRGSADKPWHAMVGVLPVNQASKRIVVFQTETNIL